MYHSIGILFLLFLSLTGHAADDWELKKEKKGIRVYTKEFKNSEFRAFKAEMKVVATLSTLMAVHADVEYVKEWLKDCSESELLTEFDPKGYYSYFKTDAPWPVMDRDYTLKSRVEQNPETYELSIHFSAETGLVPESDDCVRITTLEGVWRMQPTSNGEVLVTYEVSSDPGGAVPSWLANNFVVDQPYYSMLRLRERLTDVKYMNKYFSFVKEPPSKPQILNNEN